MSITHPCATDCNTLQHTATRCKTLPHTHYNSPQHAATHCNTLYNRTPWNRTRAQIRQICQMRPVFVKRNLQNRTILVKRDLERRPVHVDWGWHTCETKPTVPVPVLYSQPYVKKDLQNRPVYFFFIRDQQNRLVISKRDLQKRPINSKMTYKRDVYF